MGYFPFYMDIENKKCVVVGGGKVALRKIEKLIPFKPEIKVVAPEICEEIHNLSGIELQAREFSESDINGAFMVISATDDNTLNQHIFEICREKGILINTVDDREKCGFLFPALVKSKNVTIGISTEGKSPIYARFLRQKAENMLDDDCDRTIDILNACRKRIKSEIGFEENRKKAFERILKLCLENTDFDEEEISKIIEAFNC